ncbi:hypothetical protein N7462_003112 [Penicillium macrosclerotiorum]|uniref:uncharacterized protein n=1 Tax=Penicillium macrosclerotiorum TaxID=303699 RepID=UPI002547E34E|nr:uncharacterized protein N7462_003112 [Penicillium macrosclerotiorum]KAJ5688720.1 hypothetical protein N7462_003112 [Penicillium macrosclerotiorum]
MSITVRRQNTSKVVMSAERRTPQRKQGVGRVDEREKKRESAGVRIGRFEEGESWDGRSGQDPTPAHIVTPVEASIQYAARQSLKVPGSCSIHLLRLVHLGLLHLARNNHLAFFETDSKREEEKAYRERT